MPDPFRNYDAWLEAPIQQAYAESDAFVDWCESHDIDPDADDARSQYEEAIETAQEMAAEDAAERKADYEMDRMMEQGEW